MCLAATHAAVRERVDHARLPRISRRGFLAAGGGPALGAAFSARPALATPPPGRGTQDKIRDLTHVFRDGFPVYGFSNPERKTLVTVEEDGFYANQWTFPEHAGTHVDAPGLFSTPYALLAALVVRATGLTPVTVLAETRAWATWS